MSKTIRLTPIKVRKEDGTFMTIDAIGSAGNSGGEGSTNKQLLQYDGTSIKDSDGNVLTHDAVYNMLMESPDFVVLVYEDRAYHPNFVSDAQIIFSATIVSEGFIQTQRITLLDSNAVTVTYGKAEAVVNKTNVINDTNRNSDSKYPSVKAVADYVDQEIADSQAYVTPEMFGAVGDGVTDDTNAWQSAVDSGYSVIATPGVVYAIRNIIVTKNITIDFNHCNILMLGNKGFTFNGNVISEGALSDNYTRETPGYSSGDNYTGLAFLKSTTRWEFAREYYYEGFACYFENGILTNTYPCNVENPILVKYKPITVIVKNLDGMRIANDVVSSMGDEYAFRVTGGLSCEFNNIKIENISIYQIFLVDKSYGCKIVNCDVVNHSQLTNSYDVVISDSTACDTINCNMVNDRWHTWTTGGNYMPCYNSVIGGNHTTVTNMYTILEHNNSRHTKICNCVVNGGIGITALGSVDNCVINRSKSICAIRIKGACREIDGYFSVTNCKFTDQSSILLAYGDKTYHDNYFTNVYISNCYCSANGKSVTVSNGGKAVDNSMVYMKHVILSNCRNIYVDLGKIDGDDLYSIDGFILDLFDCSNLVIYPRPDLRYYETINISNTRITSYMERTRIKELYFDTFYLQQPSYILSDAADVEITDKIIGDTSLVLISPKILSDCGDVNIGKMFMNQQRYLWNVTKNKTDGIVRGRIYDADNVTLLYGDPNTDGYQTAKP